MTASAAPGRMGGYRERFYSAQDGRRLYFRDYGDARSPLAPVLCLAGLTRNSKDFAVLAERLSAEGRRVLCPDYRGRGKSEYDPDPQNYHPRTYVDDVRHLLVATNVHRVCVVGTSMGGLLAMVLGVAMPTALAGVVLNDVGPVINDRALGAILDRLGVDPPLPDWDTAAQRLQAQMPGFPRRTDEDWMTVARGTYREGGDGLLRYDWDPMLLRPLQGDRGEGVDLWPLFRALGRVPVVALRGANSELLTEDTFRTMSEEMPAMTPVVVPDTGHVPDLGEPEAQKAIDDLLARI